MKFRSGKYYQWTSPQSVPFVSSLNDCDPFFFHDGGKLYFVSTRPKKGRGGSRDWDIWYVIRSGEGWSEPYFFFTRGGDIYWVRVEAIL